MYSLKNKVAIVTGGANGIGASVVREFVNEGVKYVAIIDVEDDTGKALENEFITTHGKGTVNFFNCDVTKEEQLFDVFNKVVHDHGHIDILINNAAVADESVEKCKRAIEVNFTAIVISSLKALELMRVDNGGKGGTIINISSVVALSHHLGQLPVYAATKSAILQFSNRLGMDDYFPRSNVRVVTVCFGATDTNILNTCKGFDEKIDESIRNFCDNCQRQTTEEAAKGIVLSYKNGRSGSTWLINKSNTLEITEKINKGYEIMSADFVV